LSYDSLHNSYLNESRTADATAKPVAPLPAPPASSSDWGVLPYLWNLALAEKQMSWRIGVAFMCMLISKAAGRLTELGLIMLYMHSSQPSILALLSSSAFVDAIHVPQQLCV
jgi:hypothetical protein